jgi:small subunit ribosomal protein S5
VTAFYSTSKAMLLPAPEGTGVIAAGAARAVLELAGVKDIRTKSYGSNNPINTVKATLEALRQLRSAEQVAKMRGKTVEELLG